MKVTIIMLAALAISAALKNRSAAVRHWVLAVGITCAGLAPILGTVLPEWHPAVGRQLISGAPVQTAQPSTTTSVEFSMPSGEHFGAASSGMSLDRALRLIWIAGTTLSLLLLAVGLCRLAVLASGSRRVRESRWQHVLGSVLLLESRHPTLLVTWGFFHPKIVLPVSARDWSDERMHIVLLHELAHIQRGDWFVQMLGEIVRSVYWFNPVAWIVCRRLRQESEQACDDAVLRCGVDGPEYASQLLSLARDLRQPRRTMFSGFPAPAMARPSSLGKRVSAMLNTRIDRNPITLSARIATALALVLFAIPIVAAQAFGTFSGTLVDATGAPLPGATVSLSDTRRQSKYEVKTGPAGTFEFVGLPSGTYEVAAQQMGFATFHDTLSLASGQNLQRRLQLQVGSLEETIVVTVSDADPSEQASRQTAVTMRKAPPQTNLSECVATAVGGNIRAPKKIADKHPEYPAALRGTGIIGVVVLDATIGLDGFLKDIDVREGANPDLAYAAVAAVREWQYTQTLLNCSPIEVRVKITTTFAQKP